MAEDESRLARRNVKALVEASLMSHNHQTGILENRFRTYFQKVWVAFSMYNCRWGRCVQIRGIR